MPTTSPHLAGAAPAARSRRASGGPPAPRRVRRRPTVLRGTADQATELGICPWLWGGCLLRRRRNTRLRVRGEHPPSASRGNGTGLGQTPEGRGSANFPEPPYPKFAQRQSSNTVQCHETAGHPDQTLDSANEPLKQVQDLTGTSPVTPLTHPITTSEQRRSKPVIGAVTWVIRCTPVGDEA